MKAECSNGNVPKSVASFPFAQLKGHTGPLHAIQFTPDGKYCLTAGDDRTVRLWNPTRLDPAFPTDHSQYISSRQTVSEYSVPVDAIPPALPIQTYVDGHTHAVTSVDIDEKSTTLLASSNRTLVVSDILTGKLKRRFNGHTAVINNVSCSASADAFVTGSYDGTVRIWDNRSWNNNPIQVLDQAKDSVTCTSILQNDSSSEIITAGIDGTVRTYDLRKGEIRSDKLWEGITGMAISNDLKLVLCNCLDGSMVLMERDTGEMLNVYENVHIAGKYALDCAFSADDEYVMSGSEDGKVVIYRLVQGDKIQCLGGHGQPVCSVAAHPKVERNSVVLSAGYDGSAIIWANLDDASNWV